MDDCFQGAVWVGDSALSISRLSKSVFKPGFIINSHIGSLCAREEMVKTK